MISVVKRSILPDTFLRGKKNAKTAELVIWTADDLSLDEKDLGLNGSPTQVVSIFTPKHDKKTEKVAVPPEEAVELIIKRLDEMTRK